MEIDDISGAVERLLIPQTKFISLDLVVEHVSSNLRRC
jgi:hypothetical protein